jgi:hypothetical protein
MLKAKFHAHTKLEEKLDVPLLTAKEAQWLVSTMSIAILKIGSFVPTQQLMTHTQGWTGMTR